MSAITIMAAFLDRELRARGVVMPQGECETVLRNVIDDAAAVACTYETSRPGLVPPSGRVTDGGCIAPGDASAVDFSGKE